jgi:hypothetical protein
MYNFFFLHYKLYKEHTSQLLYIIAKLQNILDSPHIFLDFFFHYKYIYKEHTSQLLYILATHFHYFFLTIISFSKTSIFYSHMHLLFSILAKKIKFYILTTHFSKHLHPIVYFNYSL